MKRVVLLILLVLMLLPLSANASLGYTAFLTGFTDGNNSATAAFALGGIFSPFVEKHLFDVEVDLLFVPYSSVFYGADISFSSPLLWTLNNPFNALFSNKTAWLINVAAGARIDIRNRVQFYASVAPFTFQEKHYLTELLSPYILYDSTTGELAWGATIMKFSAFLGD